jgi:hypothetical protein
LRGLNALSFPFVTDTAPKIRLTKWLMPHTLLDRERLKNTKLGYAVPTI